MVLVYWHLLLVFTAVELVAVTRNHCMWRLFLKVVQWSVHSQDRAVNCNPYIAPGHHYWHSEIVYDIASQNVVDSGPELAFRIAQLDS